MRSSLRLRCAFAVGMNFSYASSKLRRESYASSVMDTPCRWLDSPQLPRQLQAISKMTFIFKSED